MIETFLILFSVVLIADANDRVSEYIRQRKHYDEILTRYEGVTEQHANTSFEFGLMNDTYYNLFREHDLLEYANSNSVH